MTTHLRRYAGTEAGTSKDIVSEEGMTAPWSCATKTTCGRLERFAMAPWGVQAETPSLFSTNASSSQRFARLGVGPIQAGGGVLQDLSLSDLSGRRSFWLASHTPRAGASAVLRSRLRSRQPLERHPPINRTPDVLTRRRSAIRRRGAACRGRRAAQRYSSRSAISGSTLRRAAGRDERGDRCDHRKQQRHADERRGIERRQAEKQLIEIPRECRGAAEPERDAGER